MKRIAVVGSINADLVANVARSPLPGETIQGESFAVHCGGKGSNQASAAGRLGAEVAMLGCVGDDAYGRMLLENLRSSGVDVSRVSLLESIATGTALITVEKTAENRIIIVPGANACLGETEISEWGSTFSAETILLVQLETPLSTVAKALEVAKEARSRTVLDPAPARRLEKKLLAKVDYLTPNESELATLCDCDLGPGAPLEKIENAAKSLVNRSVGAVVVKLGSNGALFVSENDIQHVPGYQVVALDTTAAGDCFNGAFATRLLEGFSEILAIRFACAAAALSVTKAGAQSSLPSREEVEAFINEQGQPYEE